MPLVRIMADLYIRLYILMTGWALGLGISLLAGGGDRFILPTFSGPANLVSVFGLDPWLVWGIVFIALGLIMVLAFGNMTAVYALHLGMVLYAFWGIGFLVGLIRDSTTPATGVIAYFSAALIHGVLADHVVNASEEYHIEDPKG